MTNDNLMTPLYYFCTWPWSDKESCDLLLKYLPEELVERSDEGVKLSFREDFQVFTLGGAWGRNITCRRNRDGTYSHDGCWTPKARVGDLLFTPRESGMHAISIFFEVRGCESVHDGFFATSLSIGHFEKYSEGTKQLFRSRLLK